MKKVLILGGNSFVAKSLLKNLKKDRFGFSSLLVSSLTRKQLDILDFEALKEYFLENDYYDAVIHCGLSGDGRLLNSQDGAQNFYENLLMQENLLKLSDLYGRLIVFSSGAQENRKKDIVLHKVREYGDPPTNYYSLAKYINSQRAENQHKVSNLRIFNVFGPGEKDNRFIKHNILKRINTPGEVISVWGDRYFDFFYEGDLAMVVRQQIDHTYSYDEVNLVYRQKYKMSTIATQIANLQASEDLHTPVSPLDIWAEGVNNEYTGCPDALYKLKGAFNSHIHHDFVGLERGIEITFGKLLNEQISRKD